MSVYTYMCTYMYIWYVYIHIYDICDMYDIYEVYIYTYFCINIYNIYDRLWHFYILDAPNMVSYFGCVLY